MIAATNVSKSLGEREILSSIDLRIDRGIVALLGRNGAGKTTLMRLLAGIWKPSAGEVSIDGHDLLREPVEAKRALGYQPEHPDLHPRMRPRELLDFVAAARALGRDATQRIAEELEVVALLDKRCGTLSQGQRRLVTLAAATMHKPPALLLDEPTNALDPHRVAALKAYLRGADAPRAALVSTHQLDFVVTIAERFVLMRDGRIVADGTIAQLGEQLGSPGASLEELVLRAT